MIFRSLSPPAFVFYSPWIRNTHQHYCALRPAWKILRFEIMNQKCFANHAWDTVASQTHLHPCVPCFPLINGSGGIAAVTPSSRSMDDLRYFLVLGANPNVCFEVRDVPQSAHVLSISYWAGLMTAITLPRRFRFLYLATQTLWARMIGEKGAKADFHESDHQPFA